MKESCVILADKHPNMLDGIRGIMGTEFDNVVMVSDRRSLKNAIRGLSPDLVVVDLSLPDSDGQNIVRQLKGEYPKLILIVLGLYDDADVATAVLEAGALGFVLKRTAGDDLMPAVRAARSGSAYVSPSVTIRNQNNSMKQGGKKP